MKIKVAIDTDLPVIDYREIQPLQGELKAMSSENYDKMILSLKTYGFRFPFFLWFDKAGTPFTVDGHGRLRLFNDQKVTNDSGGFEFPYVKIKAKSKKEAAKLILIASSQYQTISEEGMKQFAETFEISKDWMEQTVNFDAISFVEETEEPPTAPPPGDDPPDPPAPITKEGDLWTLNEHRVICADSVDAAAIAKLMNGKKADMVHTDPPYNINYSNSEHPTWKIRPIANDNMSSDEFKSFNEAWTDQVKKYCDGIIYCWGAPGAEGRNLFKVLDDKFHCSTTIIWNKDRMTLVRSKYQSKYEPLWFGFHKDPSVFENRLHDYIQDHEPCWFGWSESGKTFTPDRTLFNVWDFPRPTSSKDHPTMKPIAVCSNAISHASNKGHIVLDLFLGSGSTLLASEHLERICYGCELIPTYVDVVIRRWVEYMLENKRPILLKRNGKRFDHKKFIAAEPK